MRKICAVAETQGAAAEQVVEALKLDPVTAGKVLHLANSAYIDIPRKISSLKNAAALLGLPRVHSLVLVSRLISPVIEKTDSPFSLERFWPHSIAVALIAESIARHYQRYGAIDEQEAYSAGLLHDIGKLVLAVHKTQRLLQASEKSAKETIPFYKTEETEWSHQSIGKLFAAHWSFPTELSDAISGHHAPNPRAEHARIVAVVHVADVMVHTIGLSVFPEETVPPIDEKALEMVRLPPERLRIIAETEMENLKKIENECGLFRN
jgi:putative nucleotidyltransferase with HDIG domain